MLQSYSFPIQNVIYADPDNSTVKVIYQDGTFNYGSPSDQIVLQWIGIDQNTISAYVPPVPGTRDASQPGYVDPSAE